MFCPICGNLLIAKRKNGKKVYICSQGHIIEKLNAKNSATIYQAKEAEKKGTVIIEEELIAQPKIEIECPRCGNKEAYWTLEQTRSADEGETRIFTCTRCHYTWREY